MLLNRQNKYSVFSLSICIIFVTQRGLILAVIPLPSSLSKDGQDIKWAGEGEIRERKGGERKG
jgi:hypothetical protein